MKTYRIYIDESGNSNINVDGNQKDNYFFVSACVFEKEYYLKHFCPNFEKLKDSYFLKDNDNPVIFHSEEMKKQSGPFEIFCEEDLKRNFDDDLISLIKKSEFYVFCVAFNKKLTKNRLKYIDSDPPLHFCFEILIERLSIFMNKNCQEDDKFEFYYDNLNPSDKSKLVKLLKSMPKLKNTILTKADVDRLNITNIKTKSKDANVPGLQLVDLVLPACVEYKFGYNNGKNNFTEKFCNIITKKFYTYKNKIENYGFKEYP